MFGVVPKSIWQKTNPADENNLCTWAMRCLLIEDKDKLILIDNGIGDKQDAKFFSHYYLHGDDTLSKSLNKAGFSERGNGYVSHTSSLRSLRGRCTLREFKTRTGIQERNVLVECRSLAMGNQTQPAREGKLH